MFATYLILAVFFTLECLCCNDKNEECLYKGNMCNIDVEKCFPEDCWRSICKGMAYPAFYQTDAVVEFRVNISGLDRYPKDLSMYIARYQRGLLAPVKSCCNLKVNGSCLLPGFIESGYVLVAPTKRGKRPFCFKEIRAKAAIQLEWCEGKDVDLPCLLIEDGKVEVKEQLTAVSRFKLAGDRNDYCFFYAPDPYGRQGGFSPDGVSVRAEGITLNGSQVIGDDFRTSCVVVEHGMDFNLSHDLLYNNTQPGFARCTFIRTKRFDINWSPKPLCAPGPDQDWNYVIVAVTTSVIFVVLLIVIALVCKKYMKTVVPSYKASVEKGVISKALDFENDEYLKSESSPSEIQSSGKESCRNETVRYVSARSNATPSHHKEEKFCAIAPMPEQKFEEETAASETDKFNGITIAIRDRWEDLAVDAPNPPPQVINSHTSLPADDMNYKRKGRNDSSLLSTDLNDNEMDKSDAKSGTVTENASKSDHNFDYVTKRSLVLTS